MKGSSGSFLTSERNAFADKYWLLEMPLNTGINMTFLKFDLHYSGSNRIINSRAIYKYNHNDSLFGKFCGNTPKFNIYIQTKQILVHLDCNTLSWNVDILARYQVEGLLNTKSGQFYKIRTTDINEIKLVDIGYVSNHAFITNQKEATFLWQFKFHGMALESTYVIDLASEGSCPNG